MKPDADGTLPTPQRLRRPRRGDIWVCGTGDLWRPNAKDLEHAYYYADLATPEDFYGIVKLLIQAGF